MEAGRFWEKQFCRAPAAVVAVLPENGPKSEPWAYETSHNEGLKGPRAIPHGKGLGVSSAITQMLYSGPRKDYDGWASMAATAGPGRGLPLFPRGK